MDLNNSRILLNFGYKSVSYVGKGMQCSVYKVSDTNVVKIYKKEIGIGNIIRLKEFYSSLDINELPYKTPQINLINELEDYVVVEEQLLEGICPNTEFLQSMSERDLKLFLSSYVEAMFSIQNISTQYLSEAEPLDLTGVFYENKKYTDWKSLLKFNLERKYLELGSALNEKIDGLEEKYRNISNILEDSEFKEVRLIHGDYFPANVLVNKDLEITALLDFGMLTTMGDPLFDIATGWVFADMYQEIKHFNIKKHVRNLIFDRLSKVEQRRVYLYIMIFSLISANMYSSDLQDGHFLWCIKNLNTEKYWVKIS